MVGFTFATTALLVAALTVAVLFFLKRAGINIDKVYKPLALALIFVAFFRYLYEQPAVYDVRGLSSLMSPFNTEELARPFLTALAVIAVWFSYAALLTVAVSEFFEYKTFRRVVNYFSLPVLLLLTFGFKLYGVAVVGYERYALGTARLWIMAVELGVATAIVVSRMILYRRVELPRTKGEVGNLFYALFGVLICIMPCFTLQAFFEGLDPMLKLYDFTPEHRVMLYGAVILPFIIFHLLKDKSEEVKRFILIYMSLAFLWIYLGRWELWEFKTPTNWPLHLCNTAMFLIPLCLIFKMRRLYNFCLFINVMGAFLAMCVPNQIDGLNAIGTERVSYWVNHYPAFFMPVLMVAFKVFKRPKFKEWVYAVIALTVYFLAMLFTNAYFTVRYAEEVDFFFLNGDFIVSNLGHWAERTLDYTAQVAVGEYTLTFYPLYQTLFYFAYIAFTVGIWFLYALLFSTWDAAEDRRNRNKDYKRMKKELNEFLGGRPIYEPVTGDSSPRLVLRNFCKKYGSNKHYSVNNVSFEVKGGEIFGFLGPNGAGKSTIIKSVVGIQTITSGEIEICGFDAEKQPVAAKLNTGFVPDHYALYENLTGREYINYIADLFQVPFEERDPIIEKYVERFQLTGSFDNQMKTYSHGMKQKITIMAALVHNPKVWILDEPLTGLDPTSIHEVKQCMKEHAAAGNIVFFSSHIIDVVEKICDRIAIIKKGRLRACTSIKELNEKGIELEQFYLDIIYSGEDGYVDHVEPQELVFGEVTE